MRTNLIAYAVTAVIFFGMDFVWLSSSYQSIYKPRIGALLLDKPNLPVAAIFYLFYVIGIIVFAVAPALEQGNWTRALWAGALFGLFAYGTYDMTNLATLANWSPSLSVIDMVWGTIATGTAATAGYFITRAIV
jgi:uncharacterized membrane protein